MELKRVDNLETLNIGGTGSISASISQESLPFLFDLVTKSFYSNPIGSICREITSNCFDAHKEINSDEAVVIKKTYSVEDDCCYIHFIDKGIGLSRERIVNIFMNYFSSTKRESNEFIGAFGLGSKSPLSYQEMFYITSISNGKKYECILSRGTDRPELDSLHGLEEVDEFIEGNIVKITYPIGIDTIESNGTEIKIEIKDNDINNFTKELKAQLCYFDSVYFDNWGIDNNYKIIEGNTFKYRSKDNYSDIMHIVYGKVCYPIDWKQLKTKEVNIAVAVKFEIGELIVTPNRESIIYSEEIKELINNRIKACIKELLEIYNKQNPKIDDLFEYLEKRKQRPHINFQDIYKLYIPKEYGVENSTIYSYLPNITIPENPFFGYNVVKIKGEKIEDIHNSVLNIVKTGYNVHYKNDKVFNKFTNAFINDGFIITPKILDYKDYCKELELFYYKKHPSWANDNNYINDIETGKKIKRIPILGKAKLIKTYKDHIQSIIDSKYTNYNDVYVSDTWISEYKKNTKESSAAYLRKLEEKIIVKINGFRQEVKLKSLSEYSILIYSIDKESTNLLHEIKQLILSRKSFQSIKEKTVYTPVRKIIPEKVIVQFIEVAKVNERIIRKLPNSICIDNVLTDKRFQKLFRDIKTAQKISNTNYIFNNSICDIVKSLSPYYYKKIKQLQNFKVINYYHTSNDIITKSIKDCTLVNKEIEVILKEVDKFFEGLDIINYLSYPPDKILAEIFRFKKKTKLASNMYSLREPMKPIDFVKIRLFVRQLLDVQTPLLLSAHEVHEVEEILLMV